jgi:hypothetical protein
MQYNRVKVFSATKARERSGLGERVTSWLQEYLKEKGTVIDKVVTQSSDQEFHCIAITLFLRDHS